MVASGETECSAVQQIQQHQQDRIKDEKEKDQEVEEEEEEVDFIISDTNRVLFDANQMLIDLKNEIDRKNALISNNLLLVEGLKEEVARKTENLEEIRRGHKRELFEKDKLVNTQNRE